MNGIFQMKNVEIISSHTLYKLSALLLKMSLNLSHILNICNILEILFGNLKILPLMYEKCPSIELTGIFSTITAYEIACGTP